MTTVQIALPDALAREAASAGLLTPEALGEMLRERLRDRRIEHFTAARALLAAEPLGAMSPEEIGAEIEAYREGRRAAGS